MKPKKGSTVVIALSISVIIGTLLVPVVHSLWHMKLLAVYRYLQLQQDASLHTLADYAGRCATSFWQVREDHGVTYPLEITIADWPIGKGKVAHAQIELQRKDDAVAVSVALTGQDQGQKKASFLVHRCKVGDEWSYQMDNLRIIS